MADTTFRIFKVPDKELIASLLSISQELGSPDNAKIYFNLGKDHTQIQLEVSEVKNNETIQAIIAADSAIIWQIQINFPNIKGGNIIVQRQEGSDQAIVRYANDSNPSLVAPLLASAHKSLKAYERTESTDKLLGDELAEFYRRREQGLLRLEELTDKIIRQNEEYRQKLDEETSHLRTQTTTELDAEKKRLHKEYEDKNAALQEREKNLEERVKDLDDRDSRHARRQIRKDLKDELAQRGKEFTLTDKTRQKRKPLHALFILLIIVACTFLSINAYYVIIDTSRLADWYVTIRLSLSVAAVAAAIIYYIRWNDQWFRQHADEEFKLKRLELDVDRASWVVEMAHEWKDEKGTELPESLIERLANNLFEADSKSETVKHPNEDLASALIEASSGLTLNIPGLGEAIIKRRGIKKFKKATGETNT